MKAYLHIHNTWEFCHKEVMIEVEVENRPMVGDYFWMGEEIQDEFEKKITDFVEHADSWTQRDAYGESKTLRKYGICVADCIHIYDVLWKRHEDGKYYMHIELYYKKKTED